MMRRLTSFFPRLLKFLRRGSDKVVVGDVFQRFGAWFVIILLLVVVFFSAVAMYERKNVTVQSVEVGHILDQWWGQQMNWIFLTVSLMMLNIFVISCNKYRVRHPQGKIVKIR